MLGVLICRRHPQQRRCFLLITLDSSKFFPSLRIIDRIHPHRPRITLRVQLDQVDAACPACGVRSTWIHSHYWRNLGDVPCLGRPLVLLVRIRRFRCVGAACRQRTFAERPAAIARPGARHTDRFRAMHHAVALALGGNAGAGLAGTMAAPVGATTLPRRIREAAPDPVPEVRVLGVDAWAWRKGQSYGTTCAIWNAAASSTCCPIERPRPWRFGYSAIPVGDRFHLLRNSGDALRGVLDHHHGHLTEAARVVASPVPVEPVADDNIADGAEGTGLPPPNKAERRSREARYRREARFEEAIRLRAVSVV